LDGEGRVTLVTASRGTNPVSGVSYNNANNTEPVGALLTATLGAGDTQNFTYYQNTGRMKTYSASVGSTPTVITGALTWNTNGTLAENNITDGYNSANTQDCKYLYDDFIRVASGLDGTPGVNCLNGSTKIWNQTFGYDGFGNITKTTTGPGVAWACATCYNTATNQYNSTLSPNIIYDSNGNLIADTFHEYSWLADGHVASIAPTTITYDANGNKVEENNAIGTIQEYVSAFGVTAQMMGSTEKATTVDLPGGVQALYSGGTLQRFRFPDWQGTIRAESNPSTRLFTESLAFAPFGERYALKGAPYNVDSFTGKPDQIVSDEYDFPAREEHNGQGRWVSPDPMGGTGNKYVYADNNPLSYVDPYGLSPDNFATVNGSGDFVGESVWDPPELTESHPPVSWQTDGQAKPKKTCAPPSCIKVDVWAQNQKPLTWWQKLSASLSVAWASAVKTFETYTKTNPETGKTYSGRTSGTKSPEQNVAARDAAGGGHHMNEQGYGPAELDKSSTNAAAIRGREQQLIELNGGAQSEGGTSGNAINGISPSNPMKPVYCNACESEFLPGIDYPITPFGTGPRANEGIPEIEIPE
jgi:RHS repeat-associated protein